MLVVTRYPQEAVRIGGDIIVRVLKIGDRRVSLGVQAPPSVAIRREELPTAEDAKSAPGGAIRVLVVEDDPVHRGLITRSLSQDAGFETVPVASGEEALEIISGKVAVKADLVLLDLKLPGCSGLDVLRTMRASDEWRATPVVVLSSADSEKEVSQCIEAGANAFVSKAETLRDFRQSVHRIADFWGHARWTG